MFAYINKLSDKIDIYDIINQPGIGKVDKNEYMVWLKEDKDLGIKGTIIIKKKSNFCNLGTFINKIEFIIHNNTKLIYILADIQGQHEDTIKCLTDWLKSQDIKIEDFKFTNDNFWDIIQLSEYQAVKEWKDNDIKYIEEDLTKETIQGKHIKEVSAFIEKKTIYVYSDAIQMPRYHTSSENESLIEKIESIIA